MREEVLRRIESVDRTTNEVAERVRNALSDGGDAYVERMEEVEQEIQTEQLR